MERWFWGVPFFGRVLRRLNRFVLEVEVDGKIEKAYIANPGRLATVLIPGRPVALVRAGGPRKLPLDVLAVKKRSGWVVVYASRVNRIFEILLHNKMLEGLENCRFLAREPKSPRGRFDFMIDCDKDKKLVEVKSCTQVVSGYGMFPDAPTSRGQRHIKELEEVGGMVVFMVFGDASEGFFPDFHVDPAFAEALLKARNRIDVRAYEVGLDDTLNPERARAIPVRWDKVGSLDDSGTYVVVTRVPQDTWIDVGSLGNVNFPAGWYAYVGRAKRGLARRIQRHKTRKKSLRWHIDYLTARFPATWEFVVRGQDVEQEVARDLMGIAHDMVQGFGCSDSPVESHLFHFREEPVVDEKFVDILWGYKIR